MRLKLSEPQPLAATHVVREFSCGEATLDDWLKRRAFGNQASGASRTFVTCDEESRVQGFYALAAGAVAHQVATGSARRNMPDPIPVLVLGRLAVDQRAQGRKVGAALLQDAVRRSIQVSQQAGVRALVGHALHETARQFYEHYGFRQSPVHPMTLMLVLD
jgi:GNAT superfamily N-acetyltransferase